METLAEACKNANKLWEVNNPFGAFESPAEEVHISFKLADDGFLHSYSKDIDLGVAYRISPLDFKYLLEQYKEGSVSAEDIWSKLYDCLAISAKKK